MSTVIKGSASGQINLNDTTGSIQLNGSDVLTIDSSGNLTAPNNLTVTGSVSGGSGLGKILQVVQAIASEVQLNSTGGSNQVIATANITPSSSSNKILVFAGTQLHTDTTGVAYWTVNLHRDSPDIANVINAAGYQKTGGERSFYATIKLDSPATTSSITYTMKASPTGGGTIRFNYSDNGYITLLEVAA